jgi:hypothetical protein
MLRIALAKWVIGRGGIMKRWFVGIVSMVLVASTLPCQAGDDLGQWPAVAKLAPGETRPLSDAALASVQGGGNIQSILSPELIKILSALGILNLVKDAIKTGSQQKSQSIVQQLVCINKNCTSTINGKVSHFKLK